MKKHIIFTGGGTGGHVYPAIALIDILKKDGYTISWIGSKSGIEYPIIKELNIDFYSIPCGKLRRYFSFRNFLDLFKISFGLLKSLLILAKLKPDAIFSKGGYVTVPPIVASKLLKIKSFTHESDFDPGLATRINSKFVDHIFIPYIESKEFFNKALHNKLTVTGNPVRGNFFNPSKDNGTKIMGFKNDKPTVLVLGGSLGAKEINDLILNNNDIISSNFNIYHQMGKKNYVEINKESYKTVPYIQNMADIISSATIVISRSGAGAIWEFITLGKPMILIPLTKGSRGDQLKNASYFEEKKAAYVLAGDDVNSKNLMALLENLSDKDVLDELTLNSTKLGKVNCAENICKIIKEKV